MNLTIRPSKLAAWLACEKAGVHAMLNPGAGGPERSEHVATWIGKTVHARLAGGFEPPPARLLVYDGITPTKARADAQILQMHEELATKFETLGWTPLAHEVQVGPARWDHWPMNVHLEGTSDLLCVDADHKGVLVDVKTSKEIYRAWLQLGAYALAYEHEQSPIPGAPKFIDRVAVAHCPRPSGILVSPRAEIYSQATSFVLGESWTALNRVVENIRNPGAAPPAPGPLCRYCNHPECRVRMRDYQPD